MKLTIYHPQSFEEVLDWFEPGTSAMETVMEDAMETVVEIGTETEHFTEDPELLYLWSTSALPQDQILRFSAHLCNCDHCQNEIADAILCGALKMNIASIEDAVEDDTEETVEDDTEETAPKQLLSTPSEATYTTGSIFSQDFNRAPEKTSRASFSSLFSVCSACLILMVACLAIYQFGGHAVQWASSRLDMTFSTGMIDYDSDSSNTHSGSQTGTTGNRTITIPGSSSLPRKSLAMSLPPAEAQFWLIPSEFVEAPTKNVGDQHAQTQVVDAQPLEVPEIPDSDFTSAQQRIAYGQLLLRSGQNEKAKTQFEMILSQNAHSNEAKIGLGCVAYLEKHFEQAYQIFSGLCSDTSLSAMDRFIVEYNAFKSAYKLERWDELRTHAEKALALLQNEESLQHSPLQSLKEEIERELSF